MNNTTARRAAAMAVLIALGATACSSQSTHPPAASASSQFGAAQQPLGMPSGRGAQMVVPPAPNVPSLDNPGQSAIPGMPGVAPNFPSIPLSPNGGGGGGFADPNFSGGGAGVGGGAGQPQVPEGHTVTNEFVSKLTGAGSVSGTDAKFGVSGAGYASMWDDGQGHVLTAFGDTFGGSRPSTQPSDMPPLISKSGVTLPVIPALLHFPGLPFLNLNEGDKTGVGNAGDTGTEGPTGFDWRSNTLAVSTTKDLEHGMALQSFVTDRPNHAAQILSARHVDKVEITTLPTSGMSVGNRQYLGYSSIRQWGGGSGEWVSNYSGIAFSDDDGKTWHKDRGAVWVNTGTGAAFQMPSLVHVGPWVYLYGTTEGRMGATFVARVPANQVLDKAAYQYWSGQEWTNDPTTPPAPIVTGAVGETNVMWDASIQRWLMMYTDILNNGIVLRQAAMPQGPWTDPKVVVSGTDYPYVYGPHMHPWSKGTDLFFTVSQWSSYNTYLMHTTVAALPPPQAPISSPTITIHGLGGIPSVPVPNLPGPQLPNIPLLPPDFPPGVPTGPDD